MERGTCSGSSSNSDVRLASASVPFCRSWIAQAIYLPPPVLLAYFLIAWDESFPLTAMKCLLTRELGFTLPMITSYYAITFMPWMWKPVYGWISDELPIGGYRRSPYIAISAGGSALSFIAIAIGAHSVTSVFVLATTKMMFIAFLQLMVAALLVDVVRCNVADAVTLQSLVNGAKWAGSFTAQVVALFLYTRGTDAGSHSPLLSSRQAIAMAALAPTLIALMVPWLRETPLICSARQASWCSCRTWNRASARLSGQSMRFALAVLLIQVNLVVIGCQSLMKLASWERALAVSAVASLLLVLVACIVVACLRYCTGRREADSEARLTEDETGSTNETGYLGWRWVRVALFCFCANVIPGAGVSIDMLQLSVFTEESYQTLGLISSFMSLLASLCFGGVFHQWSVKKMIAASVVLAAVVGLAPLPFVLVAMGQPAASPPTGTLGSPLGALGISASMVGSISSIFTVLPIDTLVTSACSHESGNRSSTALAVFLACYSFGATVGGLISAPLLTAWGLDGKNWQSLPSWIITTTFSKLLILLLLPLLPPMTLLPRPQKPEPEAVCVQIA